MIRARAVLVAATLLASACNDKTKDAPAPAPETTSAPQRRAPVAAPVTAPRPELGGAVPDLGASALIIQPQILPELGSFAFGTVSERYAEDVPQGKWPAFVGLPKATNCPAFIAYTRRRDIVLAAPAKANQEAYGFSSARCAALEWLMGASASKRSFMRDFALTPDTTRMLPEAFATQWSSAHATQLVPRSGDRFLWTAHYPKLAPKAESATRVLAVEDRDSQVRVTYWALADVNGDGTEDAIFYVVNIAREHAGALHRLIAITRDTPTKPLRVVKQFPE